MYRDPDTREDCGEAGLYDGVQAAASIEIFTNSSGIGSIETGARGESIGV